MRVAEGARVTLEVELLDEDGQTLEQGEPERVEYRHGGGEIFEALERALEGASVGDEIRARLEPEEAFGAYQPEGVFRVPREEFGDHELVPGEWVTIEVSGAEDEDEDEEPDDEPFEHEDDEEGELEARILEVSGAEVVLDANHPLAGRVVVARARVLAVQAGGAP